MANSEILHFTLELRLRQGLGLRGKRSETVSLDSNSSTGRKWTIREQNVPSVVDITDRYIQHNGPPGTGGTEEWTFTAVMVGTETVKLAYAPGLLRCVLFS